VEVSKKEGERHGLNGALCLLPFFHCISRTLDLKNRSVKTKRAQLKCASDRRSDTGKSTVSIVTSDTATQRTVLDAGHAWILTRKILKNKKK
jgi:hypothetical protein